MNFSSPEFLFAFLPAVISIYLLVPAKNLWLLFASLVFYFWGAPSVTLHLVLLSLLDYLLAPKISKGSKASLVVGLLANVSLLLYFKYSNFLARELGITDPFWAEVALPIGISFFTFQKISFLVDVYRKEAEVPKSFVNYLLFVCLFPQLIAGPIVRFKDVYLQIENRTHDWHLVSSGLKRFSIGLAKKVLVADYVAVTADNVFGTQANLLSPSVAWLGLLCYAVQIYFDFSGYSDMAIGLGRVFGFRLLENFNKPYTATSIKDFWQRWHMSLSRWMRDYLYIPLGGSRGGKARTYLNLWIVFVISGFWHGAEWTFLAWGVYHGLFLVLERAGLGSLLARLPRIVSNFYALLVVLIGWVFFRSESIGYAFDYISVLFSLSIPWNIDAANLEITNRAFVMLVLALVLSLTRYRPRPVLPVTAFVLLLSFVSVFSSSYSPFIYFRF